MKLKKIISVLVCLLILTSLVSCSSYQTRAESFVHKNIVKSKEVSCEMVIDFSPTDPVTSSSKSIEEHFEIHSDNNTNTVSIKAFETIDEKESSLGEVIIDVSEKNAKITINGETRTIDDTTVTEGLKGFLFPTNVRQLITYSGEYLYSEDLDENMKVTSQMLYDIEYPSFSEKDRKYIDAMFPEGTDPVMLFFTVDIGDKDTMTITCKEDPVMFYKLYKLIAGADYTNEYIDGNINYSVVTNVYFK